jgi:nicotinate-nucleotide--dimethylbenzimidazole phosphoribosyltransferase
MFQETINTITPVNPEFAEKARKRLDNLTKPQGSLGRLEEFAERLVAISEDTMPVLDKKVIFTFAGDHGVAEEGVSAYPSEVTRQMVFNFLNGGAGINVLARHAGAEVVVVDIGVNSEIAGAVIREHMVKGTFVSKKIIFGTKNMRHGPAMSKDEAGRCIRAEMATFDEAAVSGKTE